jgi:CDP-diacylglycerol--serine O-phosphatidyltransferase
MDLDFEDRHVPRLRRVVLHEERRARRARRFRRGIYLLPSMFTLANMFCGYACVVYAMRGEYETAAPFIGIALVLDALDGRIARITGTATAFGVEFDSLADVVSFGIAPAILTFSWGLQGLGRLGWAVGFLFVTAAALRLARFNIQHHTDKRYFVGLPSPAAAAVPAATIYAFPAGPPPQNIPAALATLLVVIVPAFLMVSTIRFRSFKTFDLQARRPHQVLILVALALIAVATHPKPVLVLLAYSYLLSGLLGWTLGRMRRRPQPVALPAASESTTVEEPARPPQEGQRGATGK